MKLSSLLLISLLITVFCFSIILLLYFEFINFNNSFGFIITRHVNSESTNKIWLSCVTNIRKFYPNTLIVIIDGQSNYEFVKYPDNFLENCIVVESEFKGAAEFVPYYYFCNNNWFKKAIYIHDSVFINGPIDISNVNNIKFLWEFDNTETYISYVKEYLGYLNYSNELLDLFNTDNWLGSFGTMSVMDHNYIRHLADKYNLFILLNHVNSSMGRQAMERIIGILCFHDKELNKQNASIYGNFRNMQGGGSYNYDTYFVDLNKGLIGPNPIKLYFGR